MPESGDTKIVLTTKAALALRSAGLVQRGLDDLKCVARSKRVLVVSDDEVLREVYGKVFGENGFEAAAYELCKSGEWVLAEAFEASVTFNPDVAFISNNLLIGYDWLENFVLRLFARLSGCRFVLILHRRSDGRWLWEEIDTKRYGKTIGEIQAHGYKFDILWGPPEKDELLAKVRG